MIDDKKTIFKTIFLNPLNWIGFILTIFTLKNREIQDAFSIFKSVETWRNLVIGSTIYVLMFDVRYHEGGEKLDYKETIKNIISAVFMIFISWAISLAIIVNYITVGEGYKLRLKERIQHNMKNQTSEKPVNFSPQMLDNILLQSAKKYKITPSENGSIIIEILE